MSTRESRDKKSPSPATRPPPARAPAAPTGSPSWQALYERLGNRAFAQRFSPRTQSAAELEVEATRAAERVTGSTEAPRRTAPTRPPASAPVPAPAPDGGHTLPASVVAPVSDELGVELGGVRAHTGPAAAAAAARAGAQAYASGNDIVFGRGRYAPHTPSGRRLIAHELTHVAQQRAGDAPAVQLNPEDDVCAPLPAPTIAPLECPAAPTDLPTSIEVRAPTAGAGPAPSETFVLHEPILGSTDLVFYAIPRAAVDPGPGEAPECRAPPSPPLASTADPAAADRERPHLLTVPGRAPASTPVSVEGRVLAAEVITDAYVIVSQYHHLAVGAGAVTVLETAQGLRLIDAGVGAQGGAPLADAIMQRLEGIIGDRPITEVIISHLHADHTALLPRLAARFPIGRLEVNAAQFVDPRFQEILRQFASEQERGVRDRAGAQFDADRPRWEAGAGSEIADAALRARAFQAARDAHVRDAVARLRANPTVVDLLVPDGGRLRVTSAPIGTVDLPADAALSDPLIEGLRRAGVTGDIGRTAISDPSMGREAADLRARQATEPAARHEDVVVDTTSTSYIIDLPGGNRLMVVPDIRTDDLRRRHGRARDSLNTFEEALGELGHPARFTAWNMTHHAQAGWVAGGAPHVVGTNELVGFIELMHNIRDLQARHRAPGTAAPADVLTVSVQGDPGNPLVRSMVNPGMVWFLRSLGFEAFLATSGRDIRLIEALTASGQRVEGVAGLPYEGLRPTEPLLMQSEAALRYLDQQIQLQEARRASPRMRSAEKSALVADRQANLTRLNGARRAIVDARESYLRETSRAIWRGPDDAAPAVAPASTAPGPPAAMAAAEQALRAAMQAPDLAGFTPPTASPAPLVTDTALVLLRQQGGAALDEPARQILTLNQEIDVLRGRLQAGQDLAGTRAALAEKLQELRGLIERQLDTAPEASRPVLQEELVHTQRELESIARSPEGQILFTREPGTGRLIENRVVRVPSSAADRVRGVAEGAGRVLGALMVFQTIRSQEGLAERVSSGRAGVGEGIVGTIHNAYGLQIGLRMMTGIPVSPVEFVVLSVLDISQTMAGHYDSREARAVAISQSVIRNGISTILMLIGQAMMESGNPYVVAAGFGIMFLTEPIMAFLEWAGVFDAIERASAFLPSEVTAANQHLRDLMQEYRAILGAMELESRTDEQLADVGVTDPAALRARSARDIESERARAAGKERELLDAFDAGYTRARDDYAGLFELDTLRDQFLRMRRQAHEGESTTAGDRARASAIDRFADMDRRLSLAGYTPAQVQAMPQWEQLSRGINEFAELTTGPEYNWEDIRQKQQDVEQMFRNAHYRLAPEAHGMRSAALLEPGTPGYNTYLAELNQREDRMSVLRARLVTSASGTAIPVCTHVDPAQAQMAVGGRRRLIPCPEPAFGDVHRYLEAFEHLLASAPSRPFTAEDLYRHSADMGPRYRLYVREHDDYRDYLERLHATETAMRGALERAARLPDATTEAVATVQEGIESAVSRRTQQLGLLYLDELDAAVGSIQGREIQRLAPLLGERPGVRALSGQEEAALAGGELSDDRRRLSTVTNRLQRVAGLRIPDSPAGLVDGVFRVEGDIDEVIIVFIGIPGTPVRAEDNVLVGVTGPGHDVVTGYGDDVSLPVVPLNAAAVARLGGPGTRFLTRRFLRPVRLEELDPEGICR